MIKTLYYITIWKTLIFKLILKAVRSHAKKLAYVLNGKNTLDIGTNIPISEVRFFTSSHENNIIWLIVFAEGVVIPFCKVTEIPVLWKWGPLELWLHDGPLDIMGIPRKASFVSNRWKKDLEWMQNINCGRILSAHDDFTVTKISHEFLHIPGVTKHFQVL